MRGEEVVLTEAKEDVGLAHAAVSDDQKLGQVVVPQVSAHFDLS